MVVEGKGEVAAFASGGFVRFIEHGQIKRLARRHRRANDGRGLVGGENHFHAGKRRVEKTPHARGIGGDLKVEVGLRRGERVNAFLHGRVGADAEIGETRQTGFAQPFVQRLAQQRERREQDENFGGDGRARHSVRAVVGSQNVLVGRWRRARDCPPIFLRYMFGHPERDERFARAASHDGGNAVVSLQRGQQGVQCFGLVWLRRFLRRDENGTGEPRFDGAKIAGLQTIQVRATDAKESLLFIQHGGQFVAVGEQNAAVNARTVGQTDEGGKFAPSQRQPAGAELDLIGVEMAEQSLHHAIHALIGFCEAKIFEDVQRHKIMRPDLRGIVFPLRGKIGLGNHFKCIAACFFLCQRRDSRFQLGKVSQASEQMSLDEEGRFRMASRDHEER